MSDDLRRLAEKWEAASVDFTDGFAGADALLACGNDIAARLRALAAAQGTPDKFTAMERAISAHPELGISAAGAGPMIETLSARLTELKAQGTPAAGLRCDHKFIGSPHCLKCGWKPGGHPHD